MLALLPTLAQQVVAAQEVDQTQASTATKYSPAVEAKAEKFLQDAGLQRSGKLIQASETASISRGIAGLSKEKRSLRLVQRDWQQVAAQLAAIKQEIRKLGVQDLELNLQLAQATDVATNNRLAGLINASRAKTSLLIEQREQVKEKLAEQRATLNDAETKYAELILAIRKDFSTLRDQVNESLEMEQVKIAMQVMHANHGSPEAPTADEILAALDKRIARIEQEVFSESIKLDVRQGALYVDVVVGKKTMPMVVDSGASLISLPAQAAAELGIEIPADARDIRLITADGRTIAAKGVTLPRVRVGEFEAEDVEAAVLDAVAVQAEPLLGMSFLGNFKFEVDTADKSLKLLRVSTQ